MADLTSVGTLDVDGYFAPLQALLDGAIGHGFVRPEHRHIILVESDPGRLLDRLGEWEPVVVEKWVHRTER